MPTAPIILSGTPFDWEEAAREASDVVDADGNVDWHAAAAADPGVMRCPACKLLLWNEGERVRCPSCDYEWNVRALRILENCVARLGPFVRCVTDGKFDAAATWQHFLELPVEQER
jgi:hypothetical protein